MPNNTLGQVAREEYHECMAAHDGVTEESMWESVAAAVVREFLARRAACEMCEGTGKVAKRGEWSDCPRCSV